MRQSAVLVLTLFALASCAKSSDSTAPASASTGLSGSWAGCYVPVFPNGVSGTCSKVTMSITESAGVVTGTATAGNQYSIAGTLTGSAVSLAASAAAADEDWTFAGTLAGDFVTGHIDSGNSSYPLTFARTH